MARAIEAHERVVKDAFSDDYVYEIPDYQRPYSWGLEQARELLGDLVAGCVGGTDSVDLLDPYFLGSAVLVRTSEPHRFEVVDGQQRLATLSMLLAAAADRLGTEGDQLRSLIYQPAKPLLGIQAMPRLSLRERDQEFFRTRIQEPGGLAKLASDDAGQLKDAQLHLFENAMMLVDQLAEMKVSDVERLIRFVTTRTYLVLVTTGSIDSAFRVFSVLNERGLDLTNADIVKAGVLGEVPQDQRGAYTDKWDGAEDALGRDLFDELLGHIRTVYAKDRPRTTVAKEFREQVMSREPTSAGLIDDVVLPYAEAFGEIRGESYPVGPDAVDVNRLLRFLNLLDNSDWVPSALSFYRRYRSDSAEMLNFLTHLDRLAWSMFIRRVDINGRISRYARVLTAIERGREDELDAALELGEHEKVQTVEQLDGELYLSTRVVRPVLLRLEDRLAELGLQPLPPRISVEHVLPQTMASDSQWAKTFKQHEHDTWVHRIGNLVLLSRVKNSAASNYDFETKKTKYFAKGPNGGATTWAVTVRVLDTPKWTRQAMEGRQSEYLKELIELWDLAPSEEPGTELSP
jgi:Protein of unknown function DUF262/Protein of unknown function (DUF1524)